MLVPMAGAVVGAGAYAMMAMNCIQNNGCILVINIGPNKDFYCHYGT